MTAQSEQRTAQALQNRQAAVGLDRTPAIKSPSLSQTLVFVRLQCACLAFICSMNRYCCLCFFQFVKCSLGLFVFV